MSEDTSKPIAMCNCPSCGHRFDRATCVVEEGAAPSPGDCTICIECAQALVFNDDLTVRKITPAEVRRLMTSQPDAWATIERAQQAVRTVQRQRPA